MRLPSISVERNFMVEFNLLDIDPSKKSITKSITQVFFMAVDSEFKVL